MPEKETTIHIQCHCTLASFTVSISSSALPLGSAICHCSSCRHVTGQLAGTFAALPSEIRLDVSKLTRYPSSEWYTRYFCPRCGAHVANYAEEKWRLCTGLLDRMEEGLVERKQIFANAEATGDGGMSVWLSGVAESQGGGETGEGRNGTYFVPGGSAGDRETVSASCHCRGVRFMLTRPNKAEPGLKGDGRRWWLPDRDADQHYAAVLDACESCRLTAGIELVAWAFVPRSNIRELDGSPFMPEASMLISYESSPGVHRDFCGRCGASVFFRRDDRDRDVWNVAVGLLEAETGARSEGWLRWEDYVSFGDEAADRALVRMVEAGLKSWQSKYGEER